MAAYIYKYHGSHDQETKSEKFFTLDPTDDDKIMAEGIGRFCEDLKLDPASLKVLIIAWKFKAATQCEFTRKEFTEGMLELG